MRNIFVNLSLTPVVCAQCGKKIRTGHRVVTNGKANFDSCQCADRYEG